MPGNIVRKLTIIKTFHSLRYGEVEELGRLKGSDIRAETANTGSSSSLSSWQEVAYWESLASTSLIFLI